MIIHCMNKSLWEKRQTLSHWGEEELKTEGFIHCSTIPYFWRVAPNFKDISEELVLLCIEESRLQAEVRFEDGDNCGRAYPHIYGLVNNSAVIAVLPFLRDEKGNYMKNPELSHIADE